MTVINFADRAKVNEEEPEVSVKQALEEALTEAESYDSVLMIFTTPNGITLKSSGGQTYEKVYFQLSVARDMLLRSE